MPRESAFSLDTAIRFFADEKSIQGVNRTISQLKSYAKTALGAIGIGLSLRELNRMSEEYRSIKNSLNAVFGDTEDLQEVQEKIRDTARDVRGEYDKIAENVTTLVKNNRRVFDVDTANRFTDIMYKLTKLSGGNNSEASAAVQSLSAAMRNGKIDRGAIDQLINNVPQAIKVLTSYYGVSQERLRSMAQAGLIRSKHIKEAFLQAGEEIDEAFKDVQLNITDVFSSFRSGFMEFIGETDEMLGITKTLAKYLQQGLDLLMKGLEKARSGLFWLSDKLGGMENVLKLLVILAGSFFVAFHFKEIINGITTITKLFSVANLKVLALVASIALVALLIDDFYHFMKGDKKSFFGDLFDAKGFDANEIRKQVFGTIDDIVADLKAIWEEAKRGAKGFARVIQALFKGIKNWWNNGGAEEVSESLGKFKDAIVRAWQALKDWWDENGDDIIKNFEEFSESFSKTLGAAIALVSDFISLIVDLLTGDSENAEKDIKDLFEHLGELIGGLLDMILGKSASEEAFTWGKDFIDSFIAGIEGEKDKLIGIINDIKRSLGIEVEDDRSLINATGDTTAFKNDEGSWVDKAILGTQDFLNNAFKKGASQPWYMRSNAGWVYRGVEWLGEKLGFWSTDIQDASETLKKSATASSRTVANTTTDSHDKVNNLTYNQTNNFTGNPADQKTVKDNLNEANQKFFDEASRAMDFAH